MYIYTDLHDRGRCRGGVYIVGAVGGGQHTLDRKPGTGPPSPFLRALRRALCWRFQPAATGNGSRSPDAEAVDPNYIRLEDWTWTHAASSRASSEGGGRSGWRVIPPTSFSLAVSSAAARNAIITIISRAAATFFVAAAARRAIVFDGFLDDIVQLIPRDVETSRRPIGSRTGREGRRRKHRVRQVFVWAKL